MARVEAALQRGAPDHGHLVYRLLVRGDDGVLDTPILRELRVEHFEQPPIQHLSEIGRANPEVNRHLVR